MSVFDIDDPYSKSNSSMSKKFKESGVKRVFLLGLVPDVSESYCGLENLDRRFTVATDLKLCNILLGMMSHSSCHPCSWCEVSKEDLHQKGKQRTISSLLNLFWDFFDSQSDKKEANNFGNVIHPLILSDIDSNHTPVISLLTPLELHLLMGPVNTMYTTLEKIWPESEGWLNVCNVKEEEYHSGNFAGNESRRLLKNVDQLEALSPPADCVKFVTAFRSFDAVVSSCYGENLEGDFL